MGETIATIADDLDRTKRSETYTGSIYRFNIFTDTVTIDDTYLLVRKQQIGSSFILGHWTNGKLGVQTPQPLLGDDRRTWVTIAEYSGTTAP